MRSRAASSGGKSPPGLGLAELFPVPGTAAAGSSGGVASIDHIARLRSLAGRHANLDGVITGKAIYEGALDLGQALQVAQ